MQILVGLGNPGPAYARTRHNLGFRVLDAFAARHGLAFADAAGACAEAAGRIEGVEVTLLKPMLYMNRSGEALSRWAVRQGRVLAPGDPGDAATPLVVCDDIALPLGAARLRGRGGDGGHRGLASVLTTLGGEAVPRLRLGVAGGEAAISPLLWAEYVLAEFSPREWPLSEELAEHACAALAYALAHGLEAAASRFNRKPPVSGPVAPGDA